VSARPRKEKDVSQEAGKTASARSTTDAVRQTALQDEMQAGKDQLETYLDAMAVMVVARNTSGTVIKINRKAAEMLGYDEPHILGKNWFDNFVPERLRATASSYFRKIMQEEIKVVRMYEQPVLCKSGKEIMIRWFSTLVRDKKGKIVGSINCGFDICQEKLLESSLKESEEKHKTIFENARLGIYRTTSDGKILMANPAIVKMLGYSSFEELSARNLEKEGFHPDTPRRLFIEKIEGDGEVAAFESKWLKRDGSVVVVRENARAVRDEKGKTLYYEGSVEDIGKQRQSREELRYRVGFERLIASISTRFVNVEGGAVDRTIEQVLQEIGEFEGIDRCHIYQFSKDGKQMTRTHGWNRGTDQQPGEGRARQEVIIHPWTLKKMRRGEVVQLSKAARLEQHRVNTDAEYEYMERRGICSLLCVPFKMYRQERGFVALASEVEDRVWSADTVSLLRVICEIFSAALELKFASAALGKERKLINFLMDNIPDHIYFKDKDSRFIRVNKAMLADHGFKNAEEILGKTDFDVFTNEHATQAFSDEQEVMKTGRPILGREEKETWPDGSETWASTTKMPLYDEKGEIIGTFGVSRDITVRRRMERERRELETKIQYAQKLEGLSVLSGTIAHDFNNLLMGILGHASLALMELKPESPAWENVKQIETTALYAAELTNQMLAYSGKTKVTLHPLNLASLVKELSHLLEVSISKKAKLIYSFSEPGSMIEGDSGQLRQVVMNLIINASDAIGDKAGTITISTGIMECDDRFLSECYVGEGSSPGSYAYLEIADTGCGIDPEMLDRVFEPFFTTKKSGRGLGLAATVGIVASHKGALKVESVVGKGTTMRVLIPLVSRKGEEPDATKRTEFRWRSGGTVLVVDDDEVVCKVTEKLLEKFGFTAITAWSATSAAEKVRLPGKRVVAVLLDMTLPEITGAEALKMVRAAVGNVPIILMSGFNVESSTADIEAGTFEGFLQKPFSGETLAAHLHEVLEKE
jgi:PAS domain S-box-containing protein